MHSLQSRTFSWGYELGQFVYKLNLIQFDSGVKYDLNVSWQSPLCQWICHFLSSLYRKRESGLSKTSKHTEQKHTWWRTRCKHILTSTLSFWFKLNITDIVPDLAFFLNQVHSVLKLFSFELSADRWSLSSIRPRLKREDTEQGDAWFMSDYWNITQKLWRIASCWCLFSIATVNVEAPSPSQQRSNAVDRQQPARQCERQQLKHTLRSNQDLVFLVIFIHFLILFFISGQM